MYIVQNLQHGYIIESISCGMNRHLGYLGDIYRIFLTVSGVSAHVVKFARFWMVFVMSVRLRPARAAGKACVSPKRLGERMAGQRRRRKTQALSRRCARLSVSTAGGVAGGTAGGAWWRASHRSRTLANT